MKTRILSILSGAVLTVPVAAFALTTLDANGDGVLTYDEVQKAYPETTVEAFSAMDVNADGTLDGDEVTAAQAAGLMPASEG